MTSLLQLLANDARRALANVLAKVVRWLDPTRARVARDEGGTVPRELPESQCLDAQLVGTPHEPHEWPDPATDPWGAPTWCRGWPPRP